MRVVTVMFAMSVVIWLLSSFTFGKKVSGGFTENMNDSFLAYLGKLITPLFSPLGFADWRASVSILTGLGAKEIVISTMQVLYGNLDIVLPTVFTSVTAYGFLVFSSLYTPCIAALATMRKEYGNKMMFASLIYQFTLAWIGAFIVKIVGGLIFTNSSTSLVEFVIAGIIILVASIIILRMFNKKSSGCSKCNSCSGCNSKSCCSTQLEKEYVMHYMRELSGRKWETLDYQTMEYILSMNGNRTVLDFASFYNRFNYKKKIKEVYGCLEPLISDGTIVVTRETKKIMFDGIPNFEIAVNPQVLSEFDISKVKRLSL